MKSLKTKLSPLSPWQFLMLTALYCELVLHIWNLEQLHWGRLVAVASYALAFGSVLGFLVSLIPSKKLCRILTVAIAALIGAFWVTEYFISDAYQTYMTPKLMLQGAGGVMQDYRELIVSLVTRNLWRIGLLQLPTVIACIPACVMETKRRRRGDLVLLAVIFGLFGTGAVNTMTGDAIRFEQAYNFDSAVHSFGLNTALILDTIHSNAPAAAPEFEVAVEETTEVTEAAYEANVMKALDFPALAKAEKNSSVSALHSYVSSLSPSRKNEYTGLFAGKNLILITAEAFTAEVIHPERTPTLYRLAKEGIRFTDYYQPAWGASTTSGEFSNLMGLVPVTGGMCMREPLQQPMFLTIGHQLDALGYTSIAYHNHNHDFYERNRTHLKLGYDKFLAQYGGLEGITPVWPESDLEMMEVSVPQYIDQQPFTIYYMTVSGHSVYTQKGHAQARKNYAVVEDLDYSETVKCYLAANMELEYAMESLMRQLEEAELLEDTVIVIATDHYPYGLERSGTWQNTADYLKELYGVDSYDQFVRDHNALIIWSGSIEGQDIVVEEPVYSLDILPTLSNLFGVEYDSRLLVGRDVFSDQEPLVLWPDHSWKTTQGSYNAQTGIFTPNPGAEVSENYVNHISSLVANKITYSKTVQEVDYFKYLYSALGREA